MIKLKLSDKIKNFSKRLKKIPEIMEQSFAIRNESDAKMIIKEFKIGIREDSLNLARLKSDTIKRKRRKRYPSPKNPLMGLGTGNRTYNNMMAVIKDKNSVTIRPKKFKHHSGKITLKKLFNIHENGSRNNPSRPALKTAFKKYQQLKSLRNDSGIIKKSITQFINTGQEAAFNSMVNKWRRV